MQLLNPVEGHIYAEGEAHPAGAFVVTSTFAEHVASGRGPGIDIGNGKCGSPILTMGRFRVTKAYREATGAFVVRYALLDFPGHEAGLAHMPSLETTVGITGPGGVAIGHIGNSGGVPCHLHGGMKLNGVEIDWWPLLAQNQVDPIKAATDPLNAKIAALIEERDAQDAKLKAIDKILHP